MFISSLFLAVDFLLVVLLAKVLLYITYYDTQLNSIPQESGNHRRISRHLSSNPGELYNACRVDIHTADIHT